MIKLKVAREKLQTWFKRVFVAKSDVEPKRARAKQIKMFICVAVVLVGVLIASNINSSLSQTKAASSKDIQMRNGEIKPSGIEDLTKGVKHEEHWTARGEAFK